MLPSDFNAHPLTWRERLNLRVMSTVNASPLFKRITVLQNDLIQRHFVHFSEGPKQKTEGLEHIPKGRSFILAANHRTLFDFYVIAERIWSLFDQPPELCCPVRSNFWYDTLSGLFLNLAFCGGAMYPPIFRKENLKPLNRFSVDCMVEALQRNDHSILAIHPEGKRNQTGNLYDFLPPKPGIGHVALRSGAPIIPCFVAGLEKTYPKVLRNAFDPKADPVRVFIGAPIDYSDLDPNEEDPQMRSAHAHQIAERVMQQIAALGERDRQFMEEYKGQSI